MDSSSARERSLVVLSLFITRKIQLIIYKCPLLFIRLMFQITVPTFYHLFSYTCSCCSCLAPKTPILYLSESHHHCVLISSNVPLDLVYAAVWGAAGLTGHCATSVCHPVTRRFRRKCVLISIIMLGSARFRPTSHDMRAKRRDKGEKIK